MPKRLLDANTFDTAIDRMIEVFDQGHRVVVSFSGGKDSTICLETTLLAHKLSGQTTQLDVLMRDEEIMLPGTFEYCERVAERDEINFHWIYAGQPVINIFNRQLPYFWVFDDLLDPSEWVRQPPEYAYKIPEKNIGAMITKERFPTDQELYAVIGLRTVESVGRLMGVYSSGGYLTKENKFGVRKARPIYDWSDSDVWKAISENKWDYNKAYDVMFRMGRPKKRLRIAPPTMNEKGADELLMASKAWPRWFNKVCKRLPGVRLASKYGKHAVQAVRRLDETWEDTFNRACLEDAPEWIRERAQITKDRTLRKHRGHSMKPFPNVSACRRCPNIRSWKLMTEYLYNGDPFSAKATFLPYMEPEYFREGAGTWGGAPSHG